MEMKECFAEGFGSELAVFHGHRRQLLRDVIECRGHHGARVLVHDVGLRVGELGDGFARHLLEEAHWHVDEDSHYYEDQTEGDVDGHRGARVQFGQLSAKHEAHDAIKQNKTFYKN